MEEAAYGLTSKSARRGLVGSLLNLKELAATLHHFSEVRLEEMATSRHMPHYRLDDGTLLFDLREVTLWIRDNLIDKFEGINIPSRILLFSNGDWIGTPPPACISKVPNLHQINLGMLGCGVYFLCNSEEVVYVGQSSNVAQRVRQHFQMMMFDRAYVLATPASELNNTEAAFINYLQPKYNRSIACKTADAQVKKYAPTPAKQMHQVFNELNFETGETYGRAA